MTDKIYKLLYDFWDSFGLPAYDETSVPTGAEFPYITYEVAEDNFGNSVPLTASVWYRSASWLGAETKADEIDNTISRGGIVLGRSIWLKRGTPFRRRMGDSSDDMIRRIVINLTADFLN